MPILIFMVVIIKSCVWGYLCCHIMDGKGYTDTTSWFWLGFFFGIIPVVIALTKPDVNVHTEITLVNHSSGGVFNPDREAGDNEWKCSFCRRVNANYVGTCGCGKTKQESEKARQDKVQRTLELRKLKQQDSMEINSEKNKDQTIYRTDTSDVNTNSDESEYRKVEIIKKYKELLDMNAITQEEFDKKKAELLR